MKLKRASLGPVAVLVASLAFTMGASAPANSSEGSNVAATGNTYLLAGDEYPTMEDSLKTVNIDSSGQEVPDDSLESRPEDMGKLGYLLEGDEYPTLDLPGEWVDMPDLPDAIVDNGTGITPFITAVTCGSRVDWYRLVNTSGTAYCYRNAGMTYVKHAKIRSLCPGANQGRVQYRNPADGKTYYSPYRGPLAASQHTLCYQFANNANYGVERVQIL